jgi:hypothetical protein
MIHPPVDQAGRQQRAIGIPRSNLRSCQHDVEAHQYPSKEYEQAAIRGGMKPAGWRKLSAAPDAVRQMGAVPRAPAFRTLYHAKGIGAEPVGARRPVPAVPAANGSAIFCWQTDGTASLYSRTADGARDRRGQAPDRVSSNCASSLSDLAQRAGLGRIGALIRPFFVAGWDAIGQFPHD